jgi:5'-nucleotidase
VTYGEAFTVQPFGNNLVTMSLSAQDIKDLLEEQFAGCRGQSGNATRILLPSRGFRYTWNGAAACDARIRSVSLQTPAGIEVLVDESGRVLEASRRYRVTVNDYLAAGGDGFSTLRRGRDTLGGPLDIDALSAYLARHKAPEQAYRLDASDAQRIQRMGGQSCPLGGQPNS